VATLRSVIDNTTEFGKETRESVEGFARSAGEKLEAARTGTGEALHAAASSVRKSSAAIENVATGTADRLDATASYVEGWSLREFARNHMSAFVIMAAAIGFWAGSAMGGAGNSRRPASQRT
jgi:hypothetical protein